MEKDLKWHQGIKYEGTWKVTKKSTGEMQIFRGRVSYSYNSEGLIYNFDGKKFKSLYYEVEKTDNYKMPPKENENIIE